MQQNATQPQTGINATLASIYTHAPNYPTSTRVYFGKSKEEINTDINSDIKDVTRINLNEVTFISTTEKVEVNDYPYGRLRCTAFFSVEYSPKKGFRSVFQTINPKNGRLNAPKKSTYSDVVVPYIEQSTGHVKNYHLSLNNGFEGLNKACMFFFNLMPLFTTEMLNNLTLNILAHSKINTKVHAVYCGTNFEDIKPYLDTPVKLLVDICKTKNFELLKNVYFDYKAIDSKKQADFNPFKASEPVNIFDL